MDKRTYLPDLVFKLMAYDIYQAHSQNCTVIKYYFMNY